MQSIACIYDFDGTLTPQSMQEYGLLPDLRITSSQFWKKVNDEAYLSHGDSMLTYMRLILSFAKKAKKNLTQEYFLSMARKIEYYRGVCTWFDLVNNYVKKKNDQKFQIKHYIISSGLKEILEGIGIRKYFEQIYASSYFFDQGGTPIFPNTLVNPTGKTQYLFKINKGKEKINDSDCDYIPEQERPIPFFHMIYIGDGVTDIPSMSLLKKNGGHTIAVYNPNSQDHYKKSQKLLKEERVDFCCSADYRKGKDLFQKFCILIDKIVSSSL